MATNKDLRDQNKLRNEGNRLIEKSNDLQEESIGLAATLSDKIKDVVDTLKTSVSDNIYRTIGSDIKKSLGDVNDFTAATQKLIQALNGSVRGSSTIMSDLASKIKNAFNNINESIIGTTGNIKSKFSSILSVITSLFAKLLDAVKNELSKLDTTVDATANNTQSKFSSILSAITSPFSKLSGIVKNTFSNISGSATGVVDNIKNRFSSIVSAITSPFSKLRDVVKNELSKVDNTVDNATNNAQSKFSSIVSAITSPFSKLSGIVKNTFNNINESVIGTSDNIKTKFHTAVEMIKAKVKEANETQISPDISLGSFGGVLMSAFSAIPALAKVAGSAVSNLGGVMSSAFTLGADATTKVRERIAQISESIASSLSTVKDYVSSLDIKDKIIDMLGISGIHNHLKSLGPAITASFSVMLGFGSKMKASFGNFIGKDTFKRTKTLQAELAGLDEQIAGLSKVEFNSEEEMKAVIEQEEKLKAKRDNIQSRIGHRGKRNLGGKVANVSKGAVKAAAAVTATTAIGLIFGIGKAISKLFTFGFDLMTRMQDAVISFRKEFGFSNRNAAQFNKYLDQSLATFVGLGLSAQDLSENQQALVSTLGESRKITKNESDIVNFLSAGLGTSAEAASGVIDVLQLFGPETREQSNEMVGNMVAASESIGVSFNSVAGDIAEAGDAILEVFSGTDDSIVAASISARRLGLAIGDIASVSEGMLDFESSIASEMQAEVLLGKQLNLEKLRAAAFEGDSLRVATEIGNLTREVGDLDNMNFFQKKALADAVGLSVKQLKNAAKVQTILSGLTDEQRTMYEGLTDSQREAAENTKGGTVAYLKQRAASQPLLNVVDKLKATWGAIKTNLGTAIIPLIKVIVSKLDSALVKIKERLNTGELKQQFERLGHFVGGLIDLVLDDGFIEKVIAFVDKGISLVKRVAIAAGNFFSGFMGGIPSGGGARGITAKQPAETEIEDGIVTPKGNVIITPKGQQVNTAETDTLIATKKPKELGNTTSVVQQSIPPELMTAIGEMNTFLSSLIANGVHATVDRKKLNKSVISQNTMR